MIDQKYFARRNETVALDTGLRYLEFDREGDGLWLPKDTKKALITKTLAWGGFEPEPGADGQVKEKFQGSYTEPGSIYMYFSFGKPILAISTGGKDQYSHISIDGAIPISGFEEGQDITSLLDLPTKLTGNLGIDNEFAKRTLNGLPIYDNPYLRVSDEIVPGEVTTGKNKNPAVVATFLFKPT